MTDKRQSLVDARDKLEQAKSILEAAQSDQQQFIDALAEPLKHGRRGQDAEASLKALQEAIDRVQEAIERIESLFAGPHGR